MTIADSILAKARDFQVITGLPAKYLILGPYQYFRLNMELFQEGLINTPPRTFNNMDIVVSSKAGIEISSEPADMALHLTKQKE